MSTTRRIPKQYQGADETIYYSLTTTPWGSSPSSIVVKLFSVGTAALALTDVSTACLTGSASATGDVITLPGVTALTAGTLYRLEARFTCGANVFEVPVEIQAEQ